MDILNQAFNETHSDFILPDQNNIPEVIEKPKRKKRKRAKKSIPKDVGKIGYDKKLEVNFAYVLYSKTFRETINDGSVLQKLRKGDGISMLTRDISQINTGVRNPIINSITLGKVDELTVLLKALKRNWKKYNIKYYLDKECTTKINVHMYPWKYLTNDKCIYNRKYLFDAVSAIDIPVTSSENCTNDFCLEKTEFAERNPITEKSPFIKALHWKQVYKFFHSIIIQVIPLELFGSSYNRKCFKKATKKLLMIGRYDILSLEGIMLGMKISHCRWTANLLSFTMKSKIVAHVWIWLFKTFVLEILRSFFYITEGNQWKNQLFYFRKKDYQGLHDAACNKLLVSNTFQKVSNMQIKMGVDLSKHLGKIKPASLRFIPKRTGMRAILPIKSGGLTRSELLNANRLINYITSKFYKGIQNVRSMANFQLTWINFWKSLHETKNHSTFIVKVDIADAFGSIKLDLLLKLLSEVEKKLPNFVKFGCFTQVSTKSKSSYFYIPLSEDNQCLETSRIYPQPLTKAGNTIQINVRETLKNIMMLVNCQVIKIKSNQRYIILKGIAQGASLSSALCDLYYSAMCKKYLMPFTGEGRVLMRSVDDFIYVTPCKMQAKHFLDLMEHGIEEFNCYVNSDKTVHNLEGNHSRIMFRGTLFCTYSNQLLVPVSSLASFPPRYSIRINKFSNPGRFIILRLSQIVKARLPPLMYHPSYININTLVSNIWRTGIMVGGRLPCLIKVLLSPSKTYNPIFFCKSLQGIGNRQWPKIRSLWNKGGRLLPISRQFFMFVFLGGIYTMLGAPGHPPLKALRDKMRRLIKKYLNEIPLEENKFLPRSTAKIFKSLSMYD